MLFDALLNIDKRPSKHGWFAGDYFARCKYCNIDFVGSKGAYNCANCAYDFDEQLKYERLWREVGWQWSLKWIYRNSSLYKKDQL